MILWVLILIAIAASTKPRTSHAELIWRFGFLCRFSLDSRVLLHICGARVERQSSSRMFWVHRDVLILPLMPWKLAAVASQLQRWPTIDSQKIIRFRPVQRISVIFGVVIAVGRAEGQQGILYGFRKIEWRLDLAMIAIRISWWIVACVCTSKGDAGSRGSKLTHMPTTDTLLTETFHRMLRER